MKRLGVLVPIVTPCSRAGEPDADGLKGVCDDMMGAGCDGIFVAGSTGRGPWFTLKEKAAACRVIADHLDSTTPFFAGCMATGLGGMLENARALSDAGARGAVLTAPGYYGYNQQEIEAIFLKFADSSPLPVMIYDIPAFAGSKLDTDMLERLARHENIIGFKDSSSDFERFERLTSLLDGVADFYLVQGKEHLIADSLLGGASGMTASLILIDPRPFVALCEAGFAGDTKRTQELQGFVTDVMEVCNESFKRRPEISTIFHLLNHCLKKRGVCDNILLAHEGESPPWIIDQAERTMDICQKAMSK